MTRCQCSRQAYVRVFLRCDDPEPADFDFCGEHWSIHGEAILAAPNFIIAALLDDDGNPIPTVSEDAA